MNSPSVTPAGSQERSRLRPPVCRGFKSLTSRGDDPRSEPMSIAFLQVNCRSYLRDIHGPIYALATTESVTVPVDAVLWLDDPTAA